MYVKFSLMPDTYLVVTIVHGGGEEGEYPREKFFKLTKKKKKNQQLIGCREHA